MATNTRTVLVVEQEAALRAVVAQALATDGYRVLATGDGKDALRITARHEDEVVMLVTDVMVPGFSGVHLAELLTLDSPQLKVIYLDSGSARRIDLERHLYSLAWDATVIPLYEQGWDRALMRAARGTLRTSEDHAVKRVNDYRNDVTVKQNGKVTVTIRSVVSKNGKTMSTRGVNEKREKLQEVEVLENQ